MKKVFIDGSAGTTGLKIYERLQSRSDISLFTLPEELRKDERARKEALNSADIAFLCLPDDAARQAVGLVESDNTVIIDTSTAHRVNDDWAYGFPEVGGLRGKIENSTRIANPGCHASGFISLIAPLREQGVIKSDEKLSCFSLTGYSGGGKKMIADYENEENISSLSAPRIYALGQSHKHLPEMKKICMLENAPLFSPIVSSYFAGMAVSVPLFGSQFNCSLEDIKEIYKAYYKGHIVSFNENADESGFISAEAFSGRDDMEISVFGNSDRITLISRFDNLGKGASGAAIQNMNIILGADETAGLVYGGTDK